MTGLSHLDQSTGRVLRVDEGGAEVRVSTLADLGSTPHAWVAEGPGSLVVLGSRALYRVDVGTGVARKLRDHRYGTLYPTSLVRAADGTLFAGMRHFVVRLVPGTRAGYRQDWLVPRTCTRFRQRSDSSVCECLGGP
jgi:hypothetical protein